MQFNVYYFDNKDNRGLLANKDIDEVTSFVYACLFFGGEITGIIDVENDPIPTSETPA